MRIPLADPDIPTEPIQNNIQEEVQEIEMSEMCSHQIKIKSNQINTTTRVDHKIQAFFRIVQL